MGMKSSRKLADYIRNWKFNSLFVKTLGQLCLLVMVPLCGIIGLSYFVYNNMREEELRKQCQDAISSIMVRWEQIQDEAERQYLFICYDEEVELFFFDQDMTAKFYDIKGVIKLMRVPALTSSYVSNLCILNYNSGFVLDKNGITRMNDYPYKKEFENTMDKKQQGVFISKSNAIRTEDHLNYYWKINEGKKNALFVVQFSVKELVKSINLQEYGSFFITDGDTILLSNDLAMIGKTEKELKENEVLPEKSFYFYSRELDEGNNIEVVLYIEKSLAKGNLDIIGRIMVLFILIMFVITLGIAVWLSNKLYYPYCEIVRLIKESDNISEVEVGFEGKNELEYILKSIETRSYFYEDICLEMAKRVELLKKAQTIALQSQINPHFINNTLENINYMAISAMGRRNEVSQMVSALADMLKNSLANTEALVTIEDEVNHCKNYLKILKIRYEERFDVIWDIESEVYQCKIIRIVLQPIIENAIYHGIKHLSVKGSIKIIAKSVGEQIQIVVSDNGLGMSEEKQEELFQKIEQDVIQESQHIGLANVYQRLKLYYGEDCELRIESKMGIGTDIILRIPGE